MKKHKLPILLLLSLFFVLFTNGCYSVEPTFGIIFSANLDNNLDIYRMYGQNFGTVERLTFTPDDPERNLRPTKDGRFILFSAPPQGTERAQAELLTSPATYLLDASIGKITELDDNLGIYPNEPQTWSINEKDFLLTEINTLFLYKQTAF